MAMPPSPPLLAERARRWRRQALAAAWADGAAWLACGLALALTAAVWADQALRLPQRARWALLAAGGSALAGAAYRLLARPWLSLDWGRVLDEAGRRFPELALHLRPAWELSRGADEGVSEALRLAHERDTERLLRATPDERVFRWRPSARLRAAAAAAALGAASLWLAPGGATSRLLRPWRDVPLERFVSVSPGDASVDWGKPATISARWLPGAPAGHARHELTLWLDDGARWRRANWDKSGDGEQRFTADGLTAPLRYRLAWRDLESRDYALTPVLEPSLESPRARVHGREPGWVPLSPAEPLLVMRGALVTVSGHPNQPISRAALALSSLPQPVEMRASASGDYEATFVAQEDAELRFSLETPDGRSSRDVAAYPLRVQPDQPPTIELLSPLEPVLAGPEDSIPIAYSAKDDGGLTKISLLLRAPGGAVRELPVEKLNGRLDFVGDTSLALAGLPLGRAEFQLKAVDNASPPQAGLSAKGVVEIADLQGAHARTQKEWDKAEQSLKQAAGTLERRDLQALPQDWARAEQDLRQLAQSMAQDAYANPGIAEQTKSAADGLAAAQKSELPAAQRAAQQHAADAAARQERLARRLEQARRMLADGRALQGLQDAFNQSGRMAESGDSLQSKLDSLSRGGKASKQDAAKLGEELGRIQKQLESLQKALESLPKAGPQAAEPAQAVSMPIQSARQNADALSRALERGDFAEAARLARKLSEDLAKIQQAVGQSAAGSAAASLPRELRERVDKVQAEWSAVADEQAKLIERTQKLEEAKLARRMERQRDVLADLARRQGVAVSTAAAAGPRFPSDALASMRAVQDEFDRRRVESAPSFLRMISARARGAGFPGIADAEDDIANRLAAAAKSSGEPAGPESEQEASDQKALRQKTAALQSDVEQLESDANASGDDVSSQLSAAQSEQGAAADALGRRDSASALPRQQRALELLNQGNGQMGQSGGQKQSQSLLRPFQRGSSVRVIRQGGGSGQGGEMGFVPLPSAQEYLPPKQLREELQKSLQESRPASQDPLIKEYFKRISQ